MVGCIISGSSTDLTMSTLLYLRKMSDATPVRHCGTNISLYILLFFKITYFLIY